MSENNLPAAVASPPPCDGMSREWRMVHKGTGQASSRPMSKEEIERWTVSFPEHYEMQTRLVTPWTGVLKRAPETQPSSNPFPTIHCSCGNDWTQEMHTACPHCSKWPNPREAGHEPAADEIDILAELRKALDLRKTLAQGTSADVPPQANKEAI